MKLDLPESITLNCPSCKSEYLAIDEYKIVSCQTCGLKIHKDELINQNNLEEKINIEQLSKDLTKEIQKIFKGKNWK
ncbi:hypothetical protein [Acinetobacter indicus]|uniref:hypothetical protein n=1 Tax=Acinetobacter indicus TaxID=756892 RepID=UPI0025778C1A|nr:hypothetical protein [Acinetobacter indicus]MDM1285579.1 hypothetical protein [Acinetobacter indicus]